MIQNLLITGLKAGAPTVLTSSPSTLARDFSTGSGQELTWPTKSNENP